jgi:hypothetical protein
MDFERLNIGSEAISFFKKETGNSLQRINKILENKSGIVGFFEKEEDFIQLKRNIEIYYSGVGEPNQIEYGDFQTNDRLSFAITSRLLKKNIKPQILVEPTCGKGSFILSAIHTFDTIKQVFGIEIHENYLWILKFNLLEYFLKNPAANKPQIYLYHCNVFGFDFEQLRQTINGQELLIIGNPPWVTNATLSMLNSANLPVKTNFKKAKGIDAITGKGNFDISEYISLMMLNSFSSSSTGTFAFLIKNSVIKNIIYEQRNNEYRISGIEKHIINTQKEFGVTVDASLFLCNLNSTPEFTAKEFDFYTSKQRSTLGWINGKFASDTEKYQKYQSFDGNCPFEWRQGIKHDCAKVMEFERKNGYFENALNEQFELEEDLVYGILKSSDLKSNRIDTPRKYTIITQQRIGQETSHILERLPKTKAYLDRHKDYFLKRKSSIYNGKPMFSIFGIGEYSFKPYKIAISGLYKQSRFTLVEPNDKTLMLDDTCYFIGFDDFDDARITQFLLNKSETQSFIASFMFTDAKRAITKDLLMRIDVNAIIQNTNFSELHGFITYNKWEEYIEKILAKTHNELNFSA